MGKRWDHASLSVLAGALLVGGVVWPQNATAQSAPVSAPAADALVNYDIAAQPLSSALTEYARQSNVRVLFSHAALQRRTAPALRGAMTRDQALDRLLAGSGFTARIGADGAVRFRAGGGADGEGDEAQPPEGDQAGALSPDPSVSPAPDRTAEGAEEIVVTGTRIRGAAPVGAQLITVDRERIEESGIASTDELMRTLPQVFGGGFAQHVSFQNGNIGGGSSLNLRGLGPDATLTLVNGRRLPAMGLRGNFTDISSIPASAIERIEVLPDSASAIYGSDAVGGVVNFILRRDFDGFELGARYGGVTEGDLRETRFTLAAGDRFGPLSLFGAYEYFERSALAMADRSYLADSDLTALGGSNFDLIRSNPANLIVSGLGTFAVPAGQDGTALAESDLIAGLLNTANANEGLDALPDVTQQALFLSAELRLSPDAALFADARYAERSFLSANAHNTQRFTIPAGNAFRAANNLFPGRTVQADYDFYRDLGPRIEDGETKTIDLALGLRWDLFETWRFEPSLAYARVASDHTRRNMVNLPALNAALASSDPNVAFNPFGDGSFTNPATLESLRGFGHSDLVSETWTISARADGQVADLPAGPVRLAFGADYRHEFFKIGEIGFITTATPTPAISTKNDRNVEAAFAELLIPLFGPGFAPPLGRRVDLSLAGRFERYSDFGETTNPKIGIGWELTDALSLRASYGQSFRAPNLSDLDPSGTLARRQVRALNITDAGSPTGRSNIILILGANPDLTEQRAESWSAGLTYAPPESGFHLDLNYFDVRFSDRIASITNIAAALNPASEFASLIDRNPDPAQVAALLAEAASLGTSGGFAPADISVIVDARSTNLAITDVRGLDLGLSYAFDLGPGQLELRADATYLFEFLRAASPLAAPVDVVDTIGNPVDLRARLGASWRADRFTIAGFVNYADGYRDNLSAPQRDVDAWITFDLHLSARLGETGAFGRPQIALSFINLFDEDPPFVNNAASVGYDPSNADPLGRFLAVELSTRF
jgi:iron complex outermembrane recepter protein